MNSRSILLHPFFLLNLALLLANDLFLKAYYHNWLTGKLSDFSGIIVLTIFLFAFFPFYKRAIVITVAIFFIWWKSPFSEAFIQFSNSVLKIPINRLVDFTDLFALSVLPLLFYWRIDAIQVKIKYNKLSYNLIVMCCLFAFCYTSMPYNRYYYEEQRTYFGEYYKSTKEEAEILKDLTNAGVNFRRDSIKLLPAYEKFLHRIKSPEDSIVKWQAIPNTEDSAVFVKRISAPYYVIPVYIIEGDTLRNIEFDISPFKKRTKAWLILDPFKHRQVMIIR